MPDSQPPTQRDYLHLSNSMRDLTRTLDQLRSEMASTYVRKDVLEPTLLDLRKDVDTHSKWFTWIVQTVGAVIIVGLLGLLFYTGAKP